LGTVDKNTQLFNNMNKHFFCFFNNEFRNTNNFQIFSKISDTPVVDEIIEHKHKIQFEVGIGCIGIMFNMLLHIKK